MELGETFSRLFEPRSGMETEISMRCKTSTRSARLRPLISILTADLPRWVPGSEANTMTDLTGMMVSRCRPFQRGVRTASGAEQAGRGISQKGWCQCYSIRSSIVQRTAPSRFGQAVSIFLFGSQHLDSFESVLFLNPLLSLINLVNPIPFCRYC